MVDIGKPKYQYQVPYDENWYIIVTSKNHHFYFNKSHRKSYWQLHDVLQNYKDIDEDEFVNSIDYNYITLLIGLNGGLEALQGFAQKITGRKDDDNEEIEEIDSHKEEDANHEESEKSEESEYEVDEDAKNEFISNLLKEEGYLREQKKDQEDVREEKPEQVPVATGLVAGYSSDEEDSDEEELAVEQNSVEEYNIGSTEPVPSQVSELEEDSDEDQNQGLDLSLSDDNLENEDALIPDGKEKEAKRKEFLSLLDKFGDKISIFDTWELIEEELIHEFVKNPEYYSITEPSERENLFNSWCKNKSEEDESKISFNFVTSQTILYLKYLQEHKNEVKSLYYQQFLEKNFEVLSEYDIPSKQKEKVFMSFKIMINDFTKFEKKTKKSSSYDPGINLKKQKLDKFLKQHTSLLRSLDTGNVDIESIEKLEKESHFEKWIALVNAYNIPQTIKEDTENFIVGDEKRLQCYIEAFRNTI